MPRVRIIHPERGLGSFANTLKLLVLAEGFQAGEERGFLEAAVDLCNRILDTAPFGITRSAGGWLRVYTHFTVSSQSGPAGGSSAPAGRTTYESALDSATGTLTVNPAAVATVIDSLTVLDGNTAKPYTDFLRKGPLVQNWNGTVVLVLLPSAGGAGGETVHIPSDESTYVFYATTMDGNWHQVAIRALAAALGLGDEFELDGAEFEVPDTTDSASPVTNHPNLVYLETAPVAPPASDFPWRRMMSASQQTVPMAVHPHPPPDSAPDRTLPSPSLPQTTLELWEGGGGFRKRVYRSSRDCLMRRRIGDAALPVRTAPVPFCPVCQFLLAKAVWRGAR